MLVPFIKLLKRGGIGLALLILMKFFLSILCLLGTQVLGSQVVNATSAFVANSPKPKKCTGALKSFTVKVRTRNKFKMESRVFKADGQGFASSIQEYWEHQSVEGLTMFDLRKRVQESSSFLEAMELGEADNFYPHKLEQFNKLLGDSGNLSNDEWEGSFLEFAVGLETELNKRFEKVLPVKFDETANPVEENVTHTLNSILASKDFSVDNLVSEKKYLFQFLKPNHGYGAASLYVVIMPNVYRFLQNHSGEFDPATLFLSAFLAGPRAVDSNGRGLKALKSHNRFSYEIYLPGPRRDFRIGVNFNSKERTFYLVDLFVHKDI